MIAFELDQILLITIMDMKHNWWISFTSIAVVMIHFLNENGIKVLLVFFSNRKQRRERERSKWAGIKTTWYVIKYIRKYPVILCSVLLVLKR